MKMRSLVIISMLSAIPWIFSACSSGNGGALQATNTSTTLGSSGLSCTASPQSATVGVNQSVSISVTASNGTPPYTLSGVGLTFSSSTLTTASFAVAGPVTGSVAVNDSAGNSATCSYEVTVTSGSTALSCSYTAATSTPIEGQSDVFTVSASGGSGSYSIQSSSPAYTGSALLPQFSGSTTVPLTFSSTGVSTPTFVVADTNGSTANCTGSEVIVQSSASNTQTCTISGPTQVQAGVAYTFTVTPNGGSAQTFSNTFSNDTSTNQVQSYGVSTTNPSSYCSTNITVTPSASAVFAKALMQDAMQCVGSDTQISNAVASINSLGEKAWATNVFKTDQYRKLFIQSLYQRFFNGASITNQATLAYYLGNLQSGFNMEAGILSPMLSGNNFSGLYGATINTGDSSATIQSKNATFIYWLYKYGPQITVNPGTAGNNYSGSTFDYWYWVGQLNSGQPRQTTYDSNGNITNLGVTYWFFRNSDTNAQNPANIFRQSLIEAWFQQYLRRNPTQPTLDPGVAEFTTWMQNGGSDADVQVALTTGSSEYYNLVQSSNYKWTATARCPDEAGL